MIDRKLNPKDLDDDDLDERYRNTWAAAVGNFKFDAEASLLSIEMNRRFLEESAKENMKLSAENHTLSIENNKLSKRGVYISFLALFIALTSAVFSFVDWREDGVWQSEQIKELSLIVNQLEKSNDLMGQQVNYNAKLKLVEHIEVFNASVVDVQNSNMLLAKKIDKISKAKE